MRRASFILKLLIGICLCLPGFALGPREAIEGAYKRAALGAEYKFIEGMLAHRADNFQLLTATGQLVDLDGERIRFSRLLEPAIQVNLETKILEFKMSPDSQEAFCDVYQNFCTEIFDPGTRGKRVVSMKTYARDWWSYQSGTWRLARTQVAQQTLGQGDPLPARRVDSTLFRKPSKSLTK